MSTLHVAKVALTVVVRVDRHVLDRHLVASPAAVGEQLAQQVDDYTWRERLGYYPALGFFEGRSGVDPDLLRAAKDIA